MCVCVCVCVCLAVQNLIITIKSPMVLFIMKVKALKVIGLLTGFSPRIIIIIIMTCG